MDINVVDAVEYHYCTYTISTNFAQFISRFCIGLLRCEYGIKFLCTTHFFLFFFCVVSLLPRVR